MTNPLDNPCAYIRHMAEAPAVLYHMKLGELLAPREHVLECEECDRLTSEVAEQNPEPPRIGFKPEVN